MEEQNNNENEELSTGKLWFYVGIILIGLFVTFRSCFGCSSSNEDDSQTTSSEWVGTYEQSPWKFVLRKDGSATVRSSEDHEYETTWEDGGNWAVVGAYNGEVFLIDNNGNLSIMGKDGHKTGLFKLKKSK